MNPLTIPEIEAAIDRFTERRNNILRDHLPYYPGQIRQIEDDLREMRRLWSEIGSDEAIKEIKAQIADPKAHMATLTELKPRSRQMPDWLREHEKIT